VSDRSFRLTVVSPDRSLVKDVEISAMGAKGSEGEFAALPGHTPFLTDLPPSLMWYRDPAGQRVEILVGGGFVEVLPDKVTVLADTCEYPGEIDAERAERSRQRQEMRIKRVHDKVAAGGSVTPEEEAELRRAEIKLRRAVARVKVARSRQPSR
jgi:F-type H+-transporting ATPase subunit epsilon